MSNVQTFMFERDLFYRIRVSTLKLAYPKSEMNFLLLYRGCLRH